MDNNLCIRLKDEKVRNKLAEGFSVGTKIIEKIASTVSERWKNFFSSFCENENFSDVSKYQPILQKRQYNTSIENAWGDSKYFQFNRNSDIFHACEPKEELYYENQFVNYAFPNNFSSKINAIEQNIPYEMSECSVMSDDENMTTENMLLKSESCEDNTDKFKKKLYFSAFQDLIEIRSCKKIPYSEFYKNVKLNYLPSQTLYTPHFIENYNYQNNEKKISLQTCEYTKMFRKSKSYDDKSFASKLLSGDRCIDKWDKSYGICLYDDFDMFLDSMKEVVFLQKKEIYCKENGSGKSCVLRSQISNNENVKYQNNGSDINYDGQNMEDVWEHVVLKNYISYHLNLKLHNENGENFLIPVNNLSSNSGLHNIFSSLETFSMAYFMHSFLKHLLLEKNIKLIQIPPFKPDALFTIPCFNINWNKEQYSMHEANNEKLFWKICKRNCHTNSNCNKQMDSNSKIIALVPNLNAVTDYSKIELSKKFFDLYDSLLFTDYTKLWYDIALISNSADYSKDQHNTESNKKEQRITENLTEVSNKILDLSLRSSSICEEQTKSILFSEKEITLGEFGTTPHKKNIKCRGYCSDHGKSCKCFLGEEQSCGTSYVKKKFKDVKENQDSGIISLNKNMPNNGIKYSNKHELNPILSVQYTHTTNKKNNSKLAIHREQKRPYPFTISSEVVKRKNSTVMSQYNEMSDEENFNLHESRNEGQNENTSHDIFCQKKKCTDIIFRKDAKAVNNINITDDEPYKETSLNYSQSIKNKFSEKIIPCRVVLNKIEYSSPYKSLNSSDMEQNSSKYYEPLISKRNLKFDTLEGTTQPVMHYSSSKNFTAAGISTEEKETCTVKTNPKNRSKVIEHLSSSSKHIKNEKKNLKSKNKNKNCKKDNPQISTSGKKSQMKCVLDPKSMLKSSSKTRNKIKCNTINLNKSVKSSDICVSARKTKREGLVKQHSRAKYEKLKSESCIMVSSRSDIFYSYDGNSCFTHEQMIKARHKTHFPGNLGYECDSCQTKHFRELNKRSTSSRERKNAKHLDDLLQTQFFITSSNYVKNMDMKSLSSLIHNSRFSAVKCKYCKKEFKYQGKMRCSKHSKTMPNLMVRSKRQSQTEFTTSPTQFFSFNQTARVDDLLLKSRFIEYQNLISERLALEFHPEQ